MPHISYRDKRITFKVVYFGPGWGGKTTNLAFMHRVLPEAQRGDMIILDTPQERTLFFDFFPMELGLIENYSVHFNMYTVPGQIYYEATRRLILDGADGVAFVADSQASRLDTNLVAFTLMQENLESYGIDWRTFPIVLQYNKRDLPDPIPLGTLEGELQLNGIPAVEAVATEGRGVMETMRRLAGKVVESFQF